jgi:hypothetical protein
MREPVTTTSWSSSFVTTTLGVCCACTPIADARSAGNAIHLLRTRDLHVAVVILLSLGVFLKLIVIKAAVVIVGRPIYQAYMSYPTCAAKLLTNLRGPLGAERLPYAISNTAFIPHQNSNLRRL